MGVEMQVFLVPRTSSFRPDADALASFIEKLRGDDWVADPAKPWFPTMTFRASRRHIHAATTGAYVATMAVVDRIKRVKDAAGYTALPQANLAEWFAAQGDSDLMIVWPVYQGQSTTRTVANQGNEPVPLRYPLNKPSPLSPGDTYYEIQLWLAHDYVYKVSEVIDPFDDESCPCGAALEYDPEGPDQFLFGTSRMRARCQACGRAFDASERLAVVRAPWSGEASELRGGATFRFAMVVDCGKCWPQDEGGFGANDELRKLCESHFDQAFYEVVNID